VSGLDLRLAARPLLSRRAGPSPGVSRRGFGGMDSAAFFIAEGPMANFIAIPPEKIAQAKELYEGTSVPVRDIATMLRIGQSTFMRRVKDWGWKPRNARLADYDAAAKAGFDLDMISEAVAPELAAVKHATLKERVRAAVEREIAAIEMVLHRVENVRLRSQDAERAARTLATLVKVLREVNALEEKDEGECRGEPARDDEFRDLEEFRQELARRLDTIRRGDGE
jgi:hypothetical protein